MVVSRHDLAGRVAEKFNESSRNKITEKTVESILKLCEKEIAYALRDGNTVQFTGFGAFSVQERAARTGRNPKSGETVVIPQTAVPKFKPGKTFKDRIVEEKEEEPIWSGHNL